jgi:hypothetical protein
MLDRCSFRSLSLPPCPHNLTEETGPPLAGGRRLRPPTLPLNPSIGFPIPRATCWTRPEPKPRPESRYRASPMKLHRAPPPESPPAFPRRCSAPSPASPPLDPDPTVQIHFNPSQIDLIPVNPWPFCSLALMFSRNQPATHVSSTVFTNRSFFFWLGT